MKKNPFFKAVNSAVYSTVFIAVFCLPVLSANAQASWEREPRQGNAELSLRRIALLSSGMGYFEHSGNISLPNAEIILPFDAAAVNDALKSLVINDPASNSPSVRYASENTLIQTLKSLKIDLSSAPGIGEILNGLKGAELEVFSPNPIRGRIIGVEYRQSSPALDQRGYPAMRSEEAWLSLFTAQGIRAIAIKDIASFVFMDEKINADLNRALDLIMASRDESARNLLVTLNGAGNRSVSLSYVIPTPVWKVSYRLDLAGKEPFLQGWAIVDNDSDTDWKGVELSLVTGRPVSFIQNLYPPYRLSRPVVPLAIAGIAESRTYESGHNSLAQTAPSSGARQAPMMDMKMAAEADAYYEQEMSIPRQAASVAGGTMESASGRAAGDQFEFTLKNPVTLERRQSAMLPLVEGTIEAEKILVFSGARAIGGVTINPAISAELVNTSGMKLPAGPITVYDGGTYAGDALIEFFPENEKRIISYGEDLSVSGNVASSGTRFVTAVNISGGIMTITRRQSYEKVYTIKNASGQAKKIIIEHPVTPGSELMEPKNPDDRTGSLYRFNRDLARNETHTFTVREETPVLERVTLAQLRPDTFLSYSTNQEIPANVRAALTRAIDLKRIADTAAIDQGRLETQQSRLISEQDRIRRNLEAAGNQSPQGQEYLKRLVELDGEIDKLGKQIDAAMQETQRAKKDYDDYVAAISIYRCHYPTIMKSLKNNVSICPSRRIALSLDNSSFLRSSSLCS
jgi:hypothetical protein